MDRYAKSFYQEQTTQMEKIETEVNRNFIIEREDSLLGLKEDEVKTDSEMVKLKEEEIKELKLRQQIWESSPELKALKVKLCSAYVAKEVAAQIAEKQALAQQEKLEHQQFLDVMEERTRLIVEQEVKKKQEEYLKKLQYRKELQDQIIQAYKREEKYEEFFKEKALIDVIVKAIHEEDQREEEMQMKRMHQTKREIEEFCKMRDVWRQMEKQRLDEEDRRLKTYLEQQEREEQTKIENLKQQEAIKNQFQEQVQAAFLSQHKPMIEKKERQEILHNLGTEELREKDLKRVKEELESAIRKREQLKNSYKQQFKARRRQLEEEEAQEKLYRQQMLAQFAEDARLEQLTVEKKRLKILEHRRQVQQLLEEKQKQRAEEWEQLRALEKLGQAQEKQRAQIIEEERIRMLKKHATKLLGYLPRGVLREDDLTHLGSDFLNRFNKLKAN